MSFDLPPGYQIKPLPSDDDFFSRLSDAIERSLLEVNDPIRVVVESERERRKGEAFFREKAQCDATAAQERIVMALKGLGIQEIKKPAATRPKFRVDASFGCRAVTESVIGDSVDEVSAWATYKLTQVPDGEVVRALVMVGKPDVADAALWRVRKALTETT